MTKKQGNPLELNANATLHSFNLAALPLNLQRSPLIEPLPPKMCEEWRFGAADRADAERDLSEQMCWEWDGEIRKVKQLCKKLASLHSC